MNAAVDRRRVSIFLAFAFGIAWAVGLVVFLTGGIAGSPELAPGSGLTLAYVLIATLYMGAPALAHLLTRLATREGWRGPTPGPLLRPHLRRAWPYYLAAWFLPALLAILGGLAYFLVFPGHTSTALLDQAAAAMGGANPWVVVVAQTLIAVLIAPLINSLFTFGEEFGWRAYLLPRLMPLGARRAMLAQGVIWGVWHWPVIAMGHNYGLEYPGAPWLGMLAMVWMTFVLGVFLAWVTLRSASVWPAVIGHAAINGIAGLPMLFADLDRVQPLLGPSLAGVIGGLAFTALALALLLHPRALKERPLEERPLMPAGEQDAPPAPIG